MLSGTSAHPPFPYGYSFSPFAGIATYFSIRRARVPARFAWTR